MHFNYWWMEGHGSLMIAWYCSKGAPIMVTFTPSILNDICAIWLELWDLLYVGRNLSIAKLLGNKIVEFIKHGDDLYEEGEAQAKFRGSGYGWMSLYLSYEVGFTIDTHTQSRISNMNLSHYFAFSVAQWDMHDLCMHVSITITAEKTNSSWRSSLWRMASYESVCRRTTIWQRRDGAVIRSNISQEINYKYIFSIE